MQMKTIYKYKFELSSFPQFIPMPINAQILTCQLQNDKPHIWAIIDQEQSEIGFYVFQAFPTGQPLHGLESKKYISTIQYSDGLVFHIFECFI